MAIYGVPVTPHAGREIRGSWPGPCGFRGGSSRGVIMGPRGPRASGVRNNMVYATPCTAAYWSGLASRLLTPANVQLALWLTGRRGRVRGAGLEAGTVVRNTQYAIRKPCQTVLRNTQKAASIRTLNTQLVNRNNTVCDGRRPVAVHKRYDSPNRKRRCLGLEHERLTSLQATFAQCSSPGTAHHGSRSPHYYSRVLPQQITDNSVSTPLRKFQSIQAAKNRKLLVPVSSRLQQYPSDLLVAI